MKKLSLFMKIFFHITFCAFVISNVATPLLIGNSDIINSVLGIETQVSSGLADGELYYNTQFKNMNEVHQASVDIIEEAMSEGAVLLKNDNGALPLSKGDQVSLYGIASYYSVHTGQGSSGVESGALSDRVTLFDGLTNAGLKVNSDLNNYYKSQSVSSYISGEGTFIGGSKQQSQFVVSDIPWDSISSPARDNQAKCAIMVLARNSGEAVDLYMDTTMDDDSTRVIVSKNNNNEVSVGDSLQLSTNEKTVLLGLKSLKESGKIDKIVVLLNLASPFQCKFIDEAQYGIDGAMWVGTLGTSGATAVGKLLTGEYNPSGRTTDTFFKESKYNPVYYNFGSIEYLDSNILKDYLSTMNEVGNRHYVVYQEGIYNGYKYTETRYEDYLTMRPKTGDYDYGKVVSYPFGYGLSYSTFEYSDMKVEYDGKTDLYTVNVNVKNTSNIDGKEVVQVYLQKPYTSKDIENGIEKSSVELAGFTKVFVSAGQTVTATVTIQGKYFASYDAQVEKTYVVGSESLSDQYLLTVAKDAHDAVNNILKYKADKGVSVNFGELYSYEERGTGDKALVYGEHIDYDNKKYSTNQIIQSANENFTADYEGQEANYGVTSITNQFDDVDYQKAGYFSEEEQSQPYASRSNWQGTLGKRINLTATEELKEAQKNPTVKQDNVAYPTYNQSGFYETNTVFDEIKLIYLRGKDYDDPLWDTLLDRMTWEETCNLLQTGLRFTNGVSSISAPSSSQQNGAIAPVHARSYGELPSQSGWRGFAETMDSINQSTKPAVFTCNGIVAATYNIDLIKRIGKQTGEEAAWAGYNGIYGLGVNIHRGAYCGRTFEYYSEDGFLTGVAAGYEASGLHQMGVFVLMKHAILNDQETDRAGVNVWANEQTIREIYARAMEVAIEIDREETENSVLGVMTGMNRIGAKWTGGQGFCNTVLRGEFGMKGYAISDYNSSRVYMSPIQGVLNGNDLPDGDPAGNNGGKDKDGNSNSFSSYASGYGKLAWAMRYSAKNILYTIVNSNTMNGITPEMEIYIVTPTWQIALPIIVRVIKTMFIWASVGFGVTFILNAVIKALKNRRKGCLNE